jgi:hypothetical protein
MMIFPVGVECPLDVPVQRPYDAYARMQPWAATWRC